MTESESTVKIQTERARIAAQFRSVVGTSFFLVLILALVSYLEFVKPPLTYILFVLIFIVDFSLQAYLTWKHKVYWLSKRNVLEGGKARFVSIVYSLLVLTLILFAIFLLTR